MRAGPRSGTVHREHLGARCWRKAVSWSRWSALASACERAARYADAIRWYEEAQSRWPRDEKAADWLYNAAVWREGLGDDAGALADWQKYVRQYGQRPDAVKIAYNIGLIVERQKDARKTAEYWSSFQQEHGTDWNLLMAAALVAMLPVLAIFFAAQKYFIQGIVFTGVKG